MQTEVKVSEYLQCFYCVVVLHVVYEYLYYLHIQGTIPEHKQNDGGRIPVVEEVFVQRIAYRCV